MGWAGLDRFTTTSWVGTGFFCSWMRPDHGPGPANSQPTTLRSRLLMVISLFFRSSRSTPIRSRKLSRPAVLVRNWAYSRLVLQLFVS